MRQEQLGDIIVPLSDTDDKNPVYQNTGNMHN